MTWADFYLICFLVGFLLSLISIVAGGAHLHLPHFHVHLDVPHMDAGHLPSGDLPFLNFGTVAAFLAWFGGTRLSAGPLFQPVVVLRAGHRVRCAACWAPPSSSCS